MSSGSDSPSIHSPRLTLLRHVGGVVASCFIIPCLALPLPGESSGVVFVVLGITVIGVLLWDGQCVEDETMSSGMASPSSDSPRLTLLHLMGGIAALGLAFASLPMEYSVGLAVTGISVLVYDGLRLPVVTGGGGVRRWLPWVVCFLALAPWPVIFYVFGSLHRHTGTPNYGGGPQPWAYYVVGRLAFAHLCVWAIAWLAVVVMTRGYRRWFAWAAILEMGAWTSLWALFATWDTTGWAF